MHRNITITEMSYTIKDFEIMAPVGSRESLAAALHAGADSIYFGIESLNMRARSASTFTIDDLREIAKICDEHGVKSYLTINTIIYDEDIALMRKIVDAAKEAGISAVIAADVAVMAYCNEVGQEVHLSTQLNISNAEALKFYSRFADVVVHKALFIVDIHNPDGAGQAEPTIQYCKPYDLPYRCFLPLGLEGLLVAGRCISGTHRAHASYRVMSICMAMGEAVGIAAAMSASQHCTPRALDVGELQKRLESLGVELFD